MERVSQGAHLHVRRRQTETSVRVPESSGARTRAGGSALHTRVQRASAVRASQRGPGRRRAQLMLGCRGAGSGARQEWGCGCRQDRGLLALQDAQLGVAMAERVALAMGSRWGRPASRTARGG